MAKQGCLPKRQKESNQIIALIADIGSAGGWWMRILVFVVFGYLALITYQDITGAKTKQEQRRKRIEYSCILVGCAVLFILLKTVFAVPMTDLANKISQTQNPGRPYQIETSNTTDLLGGK